MLSFPPPLMPDIKPDTRCPTCQRPPAARCSREEAEAHKGDPPDKVLWSVQCTRCGHFYPIRAGHLQQKAA